jgi:hypothetical protein
MFDVVGNIELLQQERVVASNKVRIRDEKGR